MENLPKTMKALVAYTAKDYRLETEWPVPICGDDDIILKVEACGICAGDLKCQTGTARFWGDENQKQWVKPPFIPGHEFFGRIVKLGKNIKEYSLGERVIAEQIVPCGKCRFCASGQYWMCQPHNTFGFQNTNNGGMAEYIKLPNVPISSRVHRVPDSLPIEKALLIEPYACSKHCIDKAQINSTDIVVLSGAGTLGLGMVTYAKQRNPKVLIVLDLIDERLDKAKEFGADIVWNPSKVNIYDEIEKITDGYGCDTYIEATGHPESVKQGLLMLRKLGRFVEFSVFSHPAIVDWSIIGDQKELEILGSHLSPYCFPYTIEAITDGRLKTDGIVSSLYKIEDWKEAFNKASGSEGDFKVAFKF